MLHCRDNEAGGLSKVISSFPAHLVYASCPSRNDSQQEGAMSVPIKGPWDATQVAAFLAGEQRIPLRVACVAEDGFPRVVSLWYQYHDSAIHCVTHRDSVLAGLLAENPQVGFEVSPNQPPYCGVRGQGRAQLRPLEGPERLEALLRDYLGGTESRLARWLLSRAEEEVLLTIEPVRLYTWDYRERMQDIPRTA
jgi:nitroimidazol reductase NimA-like FMN-containing flavoprotein (pyridoxamine 5'-phosphate oxidase superfamily)